ncbi:MAG: type I-E CRISPR-associated protein Cse2/CasB [Thermoguttaceae bacterium]|nr:type I-E CRISPR-associated protein Cse2/CasB [Thermoguttaceae bacterium]
MSENEKRTSCAFIQFLLNLSPERDCGVLADLRRGFSEATETRAWPHIGRFCRLNVDEERVVCQTIAAGYATNPKNDATPWSNFGAAAKKLAVKNLDADKAPSFDATFRRLLACRTVEEVCKRLKSLILAMKAKDVAVPWESLYWDLRYWNNDVKTRWAAKYWDVPNEVAEFDADGEGGDE